jgi:N-acetylgalactosamine-6-sulfatase
MGGNDSTPFHWVSYAIVDQNWKLLSNKNASKVELYDISTDIYEATDLKESKPEVVESLLKKIEDWKATLPAKPSGDVFSAERKEKG